MIRMIWGRDFQVPRRLRDAIVFPLPRLHLERSATSPIDGFQKLLFRTGDGLAVETVLIPLAQARRGQSLPFVAGRLPDGLCLLCDGPDDRSAAIWKPGKSSTSSFRLGDRASGGPAGDRRGLHGDGRAVSQLRPGAGGRRLAALSVRRVGRGPGRSPSALSGWCRRSTDSRAKSAGFAWRSAWVQRPTPSEPSSFPWPPARRSPRSWRRRDGTPSPGAIG